MTAKKLLFLPFYATKVQKSSTYPKYLNRVFGIESFFRKDEEHIIGLYSYAIKRHWNIDIFPANDSLTNTIDRAIVLRY